MLEEISHCHKNLSFLDFVFLGKVHVNEIMKFKYLKNELEIRTKGEKSLLRSPRPNYLFKEGLWEALDYGECPFLHILRN